jgi:hypothetical protein
MSRALKYALSYSLLVYLVIVTSEFAAANVEQEILKARRFEKVLAFDDALDHLPAGIRF